MTSNHYAIGDAIRARFDASSKATLDGLVPLVYAKSSAAAADLPTHVRAASALRRFRDRLVIVQDDVDAFAVRDSSGVVRPVLLPLHSSGRRAFDAAAGNKQQKMDLEACVTLPDGRLVAFGSGSRSVREQLVVWSGLGSPTKIDAASLYRDVRSAVTAGASRLNIEGAVAIGSRLLIFHRGNDARRADARPANAIAELDLAEFIGWLDANAASPRIARVTPVDLGEVSGVPFGFTDAVAIDAERIVVLACAEDSAGAVSDGAVLGCRVGILEPGRLRMVDVCDEMGKRTTLKLEGIERRAGASREFDVVADVDRASCPAQLGRLVWAW
jgi:hypothetical protein